MENTTQKPKRILKLQKAISLIGISFFIFAALFVFRNNAGQFLASVLDLRESHKPYDGLVMPIKEIPDWVHLSSSEYNKKYSEIPRSKFVSMPEYNIAELAKSTELLSYENVDDLRIRDAKITYSVVYLGNYELDHMEESGSHPAVDIKIPEGTPIYAMGNGIVVKTSDESSGFGKHIVLKHENFPSFEDPNAKTTIYSSYNHLSEVLVSEGDIVDKDQKIGFSGQTGIATTPHLHFQIDNDEAPWHPYWPFTYEESQAAGLSFFEAINAGLGKDIAKLYTVNPIVYIQKYLTPNTENNGSQNLEELIYKVKGFIVDSESPFIINKETPFSLQAYGNDGNIIPALKFDLPIKVDLKDAACGKTSKKTLTQADFQDLAFNLSLKANKECETQLLVVYENQNYYSNPIKITDEGDFIEFVPVYDELYIKGDTIEFYIKVVDNKKNLIHEPIFNDEVELSVEGDIGDLSKTKIRNFDFIQGIAKVKLNNEKIGEGKLNIKFRDKDFSTKPITIKEKSQSVTKLEILHDGYFVEGAKEPITIKAISSNGTVTDSFETETPIELNIQRGRGSLTKFTLSPLDFENGEALVYFTGNSSEDAVISASAGSIRGESSSIIGELYSDIKIDNPYFKELKYLKEKSVFTGYSDGTFQCKRYISRVEVLKVILKALNKNLTSDISLPFTDTSDSDWYSGYVATALNNEIVSGYADNSFKPNNTVLKAEFTKMLVLSIGKELKEVTKALYPDVPKEAWFAKYVKYVAAANLLGPESDSLFHPEKEFTRCEAARAIYRTMKVEESGVETFQE